MTGGAGGATVEADALGAAVTGAGAWFEISPKLGVFSAAGVVWAETWGAKSNAANNVAVTALVQRLCGTVEPRILDMGELSFDSVNLPGYACVESFFGRVKKSGAVAEPAE